MISKGSVGMAVIQLAKLSGFTVITTASPKNNDYLKSLGADYVFPYNDSQTSAEIKKLTENKLYLAYDAISENGSTQGVIEALGSDIPAGKLKQVILVLPKPSEGFGEKANGVSLTDIYAGTLRGKEYKVFGKDMPPNVSDREFALHSYDLLERLLADKKIQTQRVNVFGGLDKVPEGFAYMRAGKNSAEKIIYHPWETKG